MKKNTSVTYKPKKPKKLVFVLSIGFFAVTVLYIAAVFLAVKEYYRTWSFRYEETIDRKADAQVQRIQKILSTPDVKYAHNEICSVLASDANSFEEPGEMCARVTNRATGEVLADSSKRAYISFPDEEIDQYQDDYILKSYRYICESKEVIEWMEKTARSGIETREDERDIYSIQFLVTDYVLNDDGTFLPKTIAAYDVNSNTGEQRTIGYFTYPEEENVGNSETILTAKDGEEVYTWTYGSTITVEDFPLVKSDKMDGYYWSWCESSGYDYGHELTQFYMQNHSFLKGDFYYVRRIPFSVNTPYTIDVVTDSVAGPIELTVARENLVLEFYFKTNYMGEIKKQFPRMIFYYVIVLLFSTILITVIHRRKVVKFEKESYRRTLMDSLSHDLKSPLTALRGYAESLKENLNSEKKESYADAILESSDYMDHLINGNMELMKLEDMGAVRNKEDVDIVKVAEGLFEKYKPALEDKGITLTSSGKYRKKVNKELIATALENLVSNTVKYTSGNGSIILLGSKDSLSLTNTAASLPDKKPQELWETFVKGDDSRTGENGSGLGLTIAKRIFDKHKIKAKIEYGKDNTFRVELK